MIKLSPSLGKDNLGLPVDQALFTTSGSFCWPPFAADTSLAMVEVEAVLWSALRGFGFSVWAIASLGSMFELGSVVFGIVLGQLRDGRLTEVMVPILAFSIVWCSSTMTANLLTFIVLAVIIVWTTHRIWDLRSVPSNGTDWWSSFGNALFVWPGREIKDTSLLSGNTPLMPKSVEFVGI